MSTMHRSAIRAPLHVAGLCALALALTWAVAALVPATHVKDAVALYDFTLLGRPRIDILANAVLYLLDPPLYILWGVLLVALAILRGHPRVALAVGLVLSLAPLSAEALKPLLAHPHARIGDSEIAAASWPSGHATAAAALALCAVLVAPRSLRPTVAALGMMFAAAVGVSLLILAWHLPSDVLGGYLLGALWVALVLAGLRAADARSRSTRLGRLGAPTAAGGVGAGVP
ncbi:MAG TPA: phosphatase PAP2 family protein [Solirubrobacteraceae bacterium]|jgi:membrane-associated phospholipid phosphatase|nr:phosphatase PAP2 family protein [Solirubrobacteraceae bacterium]